MTLLFFDGFQDPGLLPKPEWNTSSLWQATAAGRDGGANGCAILNGSGAVTKILILPSAAATCIAGVAYKNTVVGGGGKHSTLVFCSDIATPQIWVGLNTSGFIEVRRTNSTGTVLGTTSAADHAAIQNGDWHHYAAKVLLHTTTGSVQVQLDGLTVMTLTGITTSSVTGSVTHMFFVQNSSATQPTASWDDLYVCDAVDATATQGRGNDNFLGDVGVRTLLPTAAGDSTQWTPSTGSNFAAVDENPANTTDYVSDTVSGHRDLYNVTDPTGTLNNVYAVRVGLYVTKTDVGNITVKPLIKENSVVTADTAQAAVAGQFTSVYGPLKAVRPSDSALWTQTDINNLQIGQEVG